MNKSGGMVAGMMDLLPLVYACPLSDLDIEIVDQLKHCMIICYHVYYTDLIKLGAPRS